MLDLLFCSVIYDKPEKLLEATGNSDGKCVVAKLQVTTLLETGSGMKNNDGGIIDFTGYPVIGNQSDMQTSGNPLKRLSFSLINK